MKILIAGDMVVNQNNISLFKQGDINLILRGNLKNFWLSADYKLFNLEAPICDCDKPIDKSGPALKIPEECINGIKTLKPDLCLLANNHIKDHGEEGVKNTTRLLEKNNIDWIGTGSNINNLKKYNIVEFEGIKIAFYNCAETEFTIATDNDSGANPYHDYYTNKDIKELKSQADKVIVLYHGGKECYRYPSPELQKRCRIMADNGADYVICQHSHCIGCEEKYSNSTIVYGQGNFLFQTTDENNAKFFNTGLIIELDIDKEKNSINYIPIEQNIENGGINLVKENAKNEIMEGFYKRSEEINNPKFVFENYKQEVENTTGFYLDMFKRQDWLGILNNLQCETHREAIEFAIKYTNLTEKKPIKISRGNKLFSVRCEEYANRHRLIITILGTKIKIKID
jgi:poly-gamma-glutamate synthesis protein (capsule biosynthesis protein)